MHVPDTDGPDGPDNADVFDPRGDSPAPTRPVDTDSEGLCLVRGKANNGWMSVSNRRCSLPKGHPADTQHIAYVAHNVTGNGADVYWLGPWEDDRPYQGELTDRLQREWHERP